MSLFESYIDNFAEGNIVVSLAHTYGGIPQRISLPRPPRYNLGGAAVGRGVVVGEIVISSTPARLSPLESEPCNRAWQRSESKDE